MVNINHKPSVLLYQFKTNPFPNIGSSFVLFFSYFCFVCLLINQYKFCHTKGNAWNIRGRHIACWKQCDIGVLCGCKHDGISQWAQWCIHPCHTILSLRVTMTSWHRNAYRIAGPFVRGIHRSPVDSLHKGPVMWNFDCFLWCQPAQTAKLRKTNWDVLTPIWSHGNGVSECHTCMYLCRDDGKCY